MELRGVNHAIGRIRVGDCVTEVANEHLSEGINDPHLFKAVFMAGGPGSGKSFMAGNLFAGMGVKFLSSDVVFEHLLKKSGLSLSLDTTNPEDYGKQMAVRARAKDLLSLRQIPWLNGMLGLVVDGTGHNYRKIKAIVDRLRESGYDASMVFINTSLETAMERNNMRTRKLSPEVVTKLWKDVQSNMGKFQALFGAGNFLLIDRNKHLGRDEIKVMGPVFKRYALKLLSKPLKNRVGIKLLDTLKQTGGKVLSDIGAKHAVALKKPDDPEHLF